MSANILQNERDQSVDIAFKSPRRLDWVVRENPKLQAELNRQLDTGEELSSSVVNKVLDRIKEL